MKGTEAEGFARVQAAQEELGEKVRSLFAARGFARVAAEGFGAPGVVVCYTDDPGITSGAKFVAAGLQTAAGVPLMRDEPDDFQTFRVGLSGPAQRGDVDLTFSPSSSCPPSTPHNPSASLPTKASGT